MTPREKALRAELQALQARGIGADDRRVSEIAYQIKMEGVVQLQAVAADQNARSRAQHGGLNADGSPRLAVVQAPTNPYRERYDAMASNPMAQSAFAARYSRWIWPEGTAAGPGSEPPRAA